MKFWKKLPINQSKFEEIKGISTIDDLLSHICQLCKTHTRANPWDIFS